VSKPPSPRRTRMKLGSNARAGLHGRQLMVERVLEQGRALGRTHRLRRPSRVRGSTRNGRHPILLIRDPGARPPPDQSRLSAFRQPEAQHLVRWTQPGSNRRPSACHADALPTELWALEPGQCSPEHVVASPPDPCDLAVVGARQPEAHVGSSSTGTTCHSCVRTDCCPLGRPGPCYAEAASTVSCGTSSHRSSRR
jgi:hypothetical protein